MAKKIKIDALEAKRRAELANLFEFYQKCNEVWKTYPLDFASSKYSSDRWKMQEAVENSEKDFTEHFVKKNYDSLKKQFIDEYPLSRFAEYVKNENVDRKRHTTIRFNKKNLGWWILFWLTLAGFAVLLYFFIDFIFIHRAPAGEQMGKTIGLILGTILAAGLPIIFLIIGIKKSKDNPLFNKDITPGNKKREINQSYKVQWLTWNFNRLNQEFENYCQQEAQKAYEKILPKLNNFKKSVDQLKEIWLKIRDNSSISSKYTDPSSVVTLIEIYVDGRASNWEDALKIFHDDAKDRRIRELEGKVRELDDINRRLEQDALSARRWAAACYTQANNVIQTIKNKLDKI